MIRLRLVFIYIYSVFNAIVLYLFIGTQGNTSTVCLYSLPLQSASVPFPYQES